MTMRDNVPRPIHRMRRVWYDTYANLPTSGNRRGDLGYATDRGVLYRWSGTAWVEITISSLSGLAAAIPTASDLPDGSIYYETDTGNMKQVQSAAWVIINAKSVSSWAATDTLKHSNDTERFLSVPTATYTKIKETLLNQDISSLRIKFDMRSGGATYNCRARIYKNGAAVGTIRTNTTTSYVTYSEDFTSLVSGDLIQVYCMEDTATTVPYVRNLRLCADKQFSTLEGETLSDPLETTAALSATNQDP